MANNPIINSLTFTGTVAGQASIQSQGIAGGLTFLLPNTAPISGQLVTVSSINGNNVFLGWSSQQSTSVALSQLTQSGATTNQVIQWNGTAWVPATVAGGSGVTSVATAGIATGGPITTTGTVTVLGTSTNGSHTAVTDSGGGSSIATAASGMAITADGSGNAHSSGTLLSSLATTASLSAYAPLAGAAFTGATSVTVSGTGLTLSSSGGNALIVSLGQAQFQGNTWINGELLDGSQSAGTAGQVLSTTGSKVAWVD